MGIKLGDVSPVAGIATGKGMFGKMSSQGLLGAGAEYITDKKLSRDQKKAEEEAKMKAEAEAQGQTMKKGGKVKYSKDGCAVKGKTKGRVR